MDIHRPNHSPRALWLHEDYYNSEPLIFNMMFTHKFCTPKPSGPQFVPQNADQSKILGTVLLF